MNDHSDPLEYVHRIDGDDRISYVSSAWLDFAAENGWITTASEVVGSPLMAQVAGPETRHIYRLLIDRARETGRSARFHYRCDSPDCRRFMEMQIVQGTAHQVEFRNRVLRLERREPVPVLDAALRDRSRDILTMCSWCKAVRTSRGWTEVEEALRRTGILADTNLPRISHGICPTCSERLTRRSAPR